MFSTLILVAACGIGAADKPVKGRFVGVDLEKSTITIIHYDKTENGHVYPLSKDVKVLPRATDPEPKTPMIIDDLKKNLPIALELDSTGKVVRVRLDDFMESWSYKGRFVCVDREKWTITIHNYKTGKNNTHEMVKDVKILARTEETNPPLTFDDLKTGNAMHLQWDKTGKVTVIHRQSTTVKDADTLKP